VTPALVASPTDTERALQVMEACQADATDGVKDRAEKLLNIFQSDLFQALLGNSHTQVHTHTHAVSWSNSWMSITDVGVHRAACRGRRGVADLKSESRHTDTDSRGRGLNTMTPPLDSGYK